MSDSIPRKKWYKNREKQCCIGHAILSTDESTDSRNVITPGVGMNYPDIQILQTIKNLQNKINKQTTKTRQNKNLHTFILKQIETNDKGLAGKEFELEVGFSTRTVRLDDTMLSQ